MSEKQEQEREVLKVNMRVLRRMHRKSEDRGPLKPWIRHNAIPIVEDFTALADKDDKDFAITDKVGRLLV